MLSRLRTASPPSPQPVAAAHGGLWASAADLLSQRDPLALARRIGSRRVATGIPQIDWSHASGRQQLERLLAQVAQQVLPQWADAPAADGLLMRGQVLGLELEGLSPQDQELELARQYLRLADDVLQRLGDSRPRAADVRKVFRQSARVFAPGLFRQPGLRRTTARLHSFPFSGRWVRRGYTITLRP